MAKRNNGIVVFEISDSGNVLNGRYTNSHVTGKGIFAVDTEIARHKQGNAVEVGGSYECRYIENSNNNVVTCTLDIVKNREVYEFKWFDSNRTIFVGVGLMAGPLHIAVSYVDA